MCSSDLFGWSGEAVKILEQELTEMKFDLVSPGLKHQYVPDDAALETCVAFGRQLAAAIKERRK